MKKLLILFLLFVGLASGQDSTSYGRLLEKVGQISEALQIAKHNMDSLSARTHFLEGLLSNRRLLRFSGGDPDSDVVTYKVYFGIDSTNMFLEAITLDTFCISGIQQKGYTYFWRVVAFDQDTFTTGPIWSYSTLPDTRRITLYFNEPMDSASLRSGTYIATNEQQDTIPLSSMAFFTPVNRDSITKIALYYPLMHGHTYTIRAYNVRDLAGNLINPDSNMAIVSFPLEGSLVKINYESYGSNTFFGRSFINSGFRFIGEGISTNYGYGFNVDAVSLFYYFKGTKFQISAPYQMGFRGFSYCQLSGLSHDTLLVEGYRDNQLEYSDKFTYLNEWTDLKVNYWRVDRIDFSILNSNGIADFNFDRFLWVNN